MTGLAGDTENSAQTPTGATSVGDTLRGRYLLLEEIGRGGMAVVYRARDLTNDRDLALKKVSSNDIGTRDAEAAALLEHEFSMLAHLSHPYIIEVYEFGVCAGGPFYTMELLDGGDLRERTPLAWKEACEIAYDVCSSLALIHSRRFVHRDVTPRNVRCTREGRAKLIDFGAMVPMGASRTIVGTPQFMAPEVAHRSHLDQRTDLFSLGATLYHALTGRLPYAARDLVQAVAAWQQVPLPPSAYVEGIPASLDALILSLIAVEPKARPRSAFEVMRRLEAISGVKLAEPPSVSRSYLTTPEMVGQREVLASLAGTTQGVLLGRGRSVLVTGAAGLGRSRVLDVAALAAETLGVRAIRVSGGATRAGALQTAQLMAEQLAEASPDLAFRAAISAGVRHALFVGDPSGHDEERPRPKILDLRSSAIAPFELQRALGQWILHASDGAPLALFVDDVHRVDSASLALIAALAAEVEGRRLLLVASAESGAEPNDALAFAALTRHSAKLGLSPLSRADTQRLLESVFGDVPNVGVVGDGIHAIARGNPRDCMDLTQHLVDRGIVRYEHGSWTLPVRLETTDLPRDAEEAIAARLAALGSVARWLAEAQALATYQAFTRADYARLRPGHDIDDAIADLVAQQVVTSDGPVYALAHRGYQAVLLRSLSEEQHRERHRALIALYEGKLPIGVVRHALLGGLEERALDELVPILPAAAEATNLYELTDLGALEVAATFELALTAAERIGRNQREATHLRRWLASLAVVSDDRYYFRAARGWLERLKYDAGYDIWEELRDVSDAAERLSRTMQGAFARYLATPEAERVYRPDEAVRGLVHYVGISLAIGSSRLELSITESLPALLEPFAPLAPMVSIIWRNTIASCESACRGRWERSRALWTEVYRELGTVDNVDPKHVGVFRRAVAHAVAVCETSMGISTAVEWADRLEEDPTLRVNGRLIKRLVSIEHGDLERAESLRKEAEILALQARSRQMFSNLQAVELIVCWLTRDVTGIKRCADSINLLAARSPGWKCYADLAEAVFRLTCDDLEGALEGFERTTARTAPTNDHPMPATWCYSVTGHVEALAGLGRYDEARRVAEEALVLAKELGTDVPAHSVGRALAVVEARCGAVTQAAERLDAIIEAQTRLGVTGVHLAVLYEARARVALSSKDGDAMSRYVEYATREYGLGEGASNASLDRLRSESLGHTQFHGRVSGANPAGTQRLDPRKQVLETLGHSTNLETGARRALDLICDATGASSGHLYLVEPTGVRLVASWHGEPPLSLAEFMQRYIDQSLGAADEATRCFSDVPPADEAPFVEVSTDSSGGSSTGVYRPFLLTAMVDGDVECTGALALSVPNVVQVLPETARAVGEWLLYVRSAVSAHG